MLEQIERAEREVVELHVRDDRDRHGRQIAHVEARLHEAA
jgi:hypothetical protein